jgi:hypothetical protein
VEHPEVFAVEDDLRAGARRETDHDRRLEVHRRRRAVGGNRADRRDRHFVLLDAGGAARVLEREVGPHLERVDDVELDGGVGRRDEHAERAAFREVAEHEPMVAAEAEEAAREVDEGVGR